MVCNAHVGASWSEKAPRLSCLLRQHDWSAERRYRTKHEIGGSVVIPSYPDARDVIHFERLTGPKFDVEVKGMSRTRSRFCLQEGLSLNLNRLAKHSFIKYGSATTEKQIRWSRSGSFVAAGCVSADMSMDCTGWLQIWIGAFNQRITLVAKPRHFGGRQWYFVCPATGRLASIVWKPTGAASFCSRHAWAGKVAYLSQFGSWIDRAHLGKARIAEKIGKNWDPDQHTFPPRPKGMRTGTYERLANKFGAYQAALDNGLEEVARRYYSSQ
jgi:hypothetical protein